MMMLLPLDEESFMTFLLDISMRTEVLKMDRLNYSTAAYA